MRNVGALLSHVGFPTQRSEQAARFSGPNSEAAELIWALEVSPTESSVLPTSPDPRSCADRTETVDHRFGHGRSGAMVACILTNCITGAVSMWLRPSRVVISSVRYS